VATYGRKIPHAPSAGIARSPPFPQGERGFTMVNRLVSPPSILHPPHLPPSKSVLDKNTPQYKLAIKCSDRRHMMADTKTTTLDDEFTLQDTFPPPTYEDWLKEAEKLLKGAPFDKVLKTPTPEGITLKPIYNAEDIANLPFIDNMPGKPPFTRGMSLDTKGWEIQQDIESENSKNPVNHNIFKRIVKEGYRKDIVDEYIAMIVKAEFKGSLPEKVMIDLAIYNDCGASAVDELGLLAASMVFMIESLNTKLRGVEIMSLLAFKFAVGTNLFMEIAKLRAARYIFSKVLEAYGMQDYAQRYPMLINTVTSTYTKTFYDPWVNVLRTTTEAFSAVVGGCDSLGVTPYDCVGSAPDDFALRLARNQQLILQEEAHLDHVLDPAGGSYYVEALTDELAQAGWKFFLAIEEQGGIIEALQNGFIAKAIDKSHAFRLNNIETRKDTQVGTSFAPNLAEKRPPYPKDTEKYTLLTKRRLSESFEELRACVEKITPRPKVFVANIGQAVANKPRIDFALGYFEVGGFITHTNDGFTSIDEALKFILACDCPVIVLSSTDDKYPEIVPDFAKKLKQQAPKRILVLAGYPKEHIEAFTQAGVDFFIYMRQNVVQTLSDIVKKLGGEL